MSESPAPSEDSTWTIARVLTWATGDFASRGLPSPRLDAEVLLAHVLGVDRMRLILDAPRPLTAEELRVYRDAIQRRRRAEPVAYIVGEREFYGLGFHVDARVLVPRPDTETLVDVALKRTRARDQYGHGLDLCTGSGCVAIALAKTRPGWKWSAVDISEDALAVARLNARRHNVLHGLAFLQSDLFAQVNSARGFDLITANPPYIPTAELPTLAPDIHQHEPKLALLGGEDGLDIVRRLVSQASRHLNAGGVLALEIGYGQAAAVVELLQAAGFLGVETMRDYGGIERVVSGHTA